MSLTRDQVLHIARLARLRLSDEEIDRMTGELSGILDHFESLQAVETADVEPTVYPLPLKNIMRADETMPSLSRDEALRNVPEAAEGYVRVRAVLE